MQITLSRKWLFVPLVGVVLLTMGVILNAGRSSTASAPAREPTAEVNQATEIERVARQVATAFGQGDLYRSPDQYPLTDSLRSSIAKIPNRGQTWPEFVGLAGDIVVVLQGKDGNGQAFTDVVIHVLSQGANRSTQLTQVDLRLIQDGKTWKADHLLTLAKGSVQP